MSIELILVRWLHLSGSILLASLFLFEALILRTASNSSRETGRLLVAIQQLICRTAFCTLITTLLSWFGWSWLVASNMSGDDLIQCLQSGDWLTVITGTQFGYVWLFRLILSFIFGINLWMVARMPERRSFSQIILIGLSLVLLISLAWAGHATATPGPFGIVHLAGDALHLLTSAFWPGALVPLIVFLVLLLKSKQVEAIALAAPVVRRFSASSLIAVAVLASTGLLNCVFMVGSFQSLLASTYGQLLISKVILFFVMVGFGAWNFLVLRPRLALQLKTVSLVRQKRIILLLLRSVLWEIVLGTLVILIVGLLGVSPPPMR
ncbi:MAG: copper resistance D family protein [Verrucomicrobia bacterium]|nr:copper resistance D family protein [Verrucomicrobiota bacterium]